MPKGAPGIPRIKKKTRELMEAFLAVLRNTANVRAACNAVGIDRETVVTWKQSFPKFEEMYQHAMADACDVLEALAWDRARKTSDVLLMFLLKAHRPELYRENYKVEHVGPDGRTLGRDLIVIDVPGPPIKIEKSKVEVIASEPAQIEHQS